MLSSPMLFTGVVAALSSLSPCAALLPSTPGRPAAAAAAAAALALDSRALGPHPSATRGLGLLRARTKDWVTEGLARELDTASTELSGQGDAMPAGGLRIGRLHVVPAGLAPEEVGRLCALEPLPPGCPRAEPVRLGNSENGWGTGCHPTTRLCLEFLSDLSAQDLLAGEVVMDYGTGSGVLAIAAMRLGAKRVVCVDVDPEVLVTAEQNLELNDSLFVDLAEMLHVREVVPGAMQPAGLIIANILVGQLVRPSMVAALLSCLEPGGLLCLSGIRPEECASLRAAYGGSVDWEEALYAEAEPGPEGKAYWGRWARLVGRRRAPTRAELEGLSELAVS